MCKTANASLLQSRYVQLHYPNKKFVEMKTFTGKKRWRPARAPGRMFCIHAIVDAMFRDPLT